MKKPLGSLLILIVLAQLSFSQSSPNVLWIYVDDMSDWMGCYGDKTVKTPNIDCLAKKGVKFSNAYMPAAVCSATRSAIITGCMQTTNGLQHHRTMIKRDLPENILTIPELFKNKGYITFNESKDDYNFDRDRFLMYSKEFIRPGKEDVRSHLKSLNLSWLKQLQGKKFFGQIQLAGGKWEGEVGSKYPAYSSIKEVEVSIPSQYPDNSVFRNATARHYEQVKRTDTEVGAILSALKEYKLDENLVIFFFTDHGCQLPRAKQFLYEEGTKVPLIVHWGKNQKVLRKKGKVRTNLVTGIDIATTSLELAGIEIPKHMEGLSLFSNNYKERSYVVSAADRMGIMVDRIRAIRTEKYRYIRNFKIDRPLYQIGYRDSYATFVNVRKLFKENKLSPLQASYHKTESRLAEELYDVKKDPHQLNNLALLPAYKEEVERHRKYLTEWIAQTDDKGQYPEEKAALELLYKQKKGEVYAPEFDSFK